MPTMNRPENGTLELDGRTPVVALGAARISDPTGWTFLHCATLLNADGPGTRGSSSPAPPRSPARSVLLTGGMLPSSMRWQCGSASW